MLSTCTHRIYLNLTILVVQRVLIAYLGLLFWEPPLDDYLTVSHLRLSYVCLSLALPKAFAS